MDKDEVDIYMYHKHIRQDHVHGEFVLVLHAFHHIFSNYIEIEQNLWVHVSTVSFIWTHKVIDLVDSLL